MPGFYKTIQLIIYRKSSFSQDLFQFLLEAQWKPTKYLLTLAYVLSFLTETDLNIY